MWVHTNDYICAVFILAYYEKDVQREVVWVLRLQPKVLSCGARIGATALAPLGQSGLLLCVLPAGAGIQTLGPHIYISTVSDLFD